MIGSLKTTTLHRCEGCYLRCRSRLGSAFEGAGFEVEAAGFEVEDAEFKGAESTDMTSHDAAAETSSSDRSEICTM